MKMMRKLHLPLLALSAFLLTSCATILSGTRTNVLIDGDVSEPLTIVADRDTFDNVALPASVSIKRSHLKRPITLSSPHYDYADIIPGRSVNLWTFANYFNGFFGLPVDLMTGAIYEPAMSRYYVSKRSKSDSIDNVEAMPLRPVGVYKPVVLSKRPERNYRHEIDLVLGIGSSISDGIHHRQYQKMAQMGFSSMEWCGFPEYGASTDVRYFYHLNRWLAVGASFGQTYARDDLDYYGEGIDGRENIYQLRNAWCHVRTKSSFLTPAVKATWARVGLLSFYSIGSLGVQYRHHWTTVSVPHYNSWLYWLFFMPYERIDHVSVHDVRQWRLAAQLTPLGISIGRRHLRFFAELGYGIEGVFNMGVSYLPF